MSSKRALIVLASAMTLLTAQNGMAATVKKTGAATKPIASAKATTVASVEEAAIGERMEALSAAASLGDSEKMAAQWTPDATFIDEDGIQTRGRQEIQQRFARAWDGRGKANLVLKASSIKLIGSEAAWVDGTSSRQTETGLEPGSRYTMLLQKQNGSWLVASATETSISSSTPADHLRSVDWVIGDWVAEQGTGKVTMNAEWTPNKNFIFCRYTVNLPGSTAKADNQIIGWDPTKGQIVSWHFDSSGGFGYGSWTQHGKQWLIQAEGVEQTGSRTTSTNIFALQEPTKISWQSVNRTVNGIPVPDTEPLVVQKVK